MRILQVVSHFAPAWGFGGPVRHVYERSKALVKQGHHVTVCTTDAQIGENGRLDVPRNTPVDLEGIETYYLANISNRLAWKYNAYLPPATIPVMRRIIPTYDIIHIHNLYALPKIVACHYANKYQIPYILSTGNTFPPNPAMGRILIKDIYLSMWGNKILRDAKTIIALTETEKERIVKSRTVSPDKIVVEPFGIDKAAFEAKPAYQGGFRQTYRIGSEELLILFVGRIHEGKGLPLLVRAFAHLPPALQQRSRLVIVGPDSNARQAVDKAVADWGIGDRVLFTGLLSGDIKLAAFADADIFVLPSFSEQLPRVALEACASSIPVIITNRCNVPQIEAYRAGYVINPDHTELQEALEKLLTDLDERRRMGQNGQRMVKENFDWDVVIQRLENIYQAAINSKTHKSQVVVGG